MSNNEQRLVAVTGATGFIGSYLVAGLQKAGQPVRSLSRYGGQTAYPIGDLAKSVNWDSCLQGVDTVIHCAAWAGPSSGAYPDSEWQQRLLRINRDVVAELAQSCCSTGVRRMIFLSTVKVYGESTLNRPPFTEKDCLLPKTAYGESKRQAEDLLRPYTSRGLQVCVLRLPLVYGPNAKGNLQKLTHLATSGFPLPFAGIDNRRSLLGVNNLLSVVQRLLDQDSWSFFALNVADPEPVSTPALIQALAAAHGKKARLLPLPSGLYKVLARLLAGKTGITRLIENLEVSVAYLQSLFPELLLSSTSQSIRLLARDSEINSRGL